MKPVELRIGDLRIEGWSRAGDATWVRVHPPGLAFDTGRGALQLAGAQDVFLSHGHLDHALGLPYVLSQRSLHRSLHTRVFCPAETAEPLAALIAATQRLERATYLFDLVPLAPGDRVEVGRNLAIEAFRVDHVVPTLGYHLIRRKRRLAAAFAGLPREELVRLREEGIDTSEVLEEDWLTYCGDTGPGVFDLEPRMFESRVLMLECTFLGEEHRDKGVLYKHLHLGDIEARAGAFRNEALVLHHLSRRYRIRDLRAEVDRRLPELAPRVRLLVEGDDK
ncbi:MAG TPA: MBL fold metallo-hydrolase [Thermoanaerobaculia bacterium]|jgi:ribonuclease Z|nr:MBL fold metallo-hydrolase [Thermoanaerobaculia bacterium]